MKKWEALWRLQRRRGVLGGHGLVGLEGDGEEASESREHYSGNAELVKGGSSAARIGVEAAVDGTNGGSSAAIARGARVVARVGAFRCRSSRRDDKTVGDLVMAIA